MTLTQIRILLQARLLFGGADSDLHVDSACGSDLMSDVLAFTHSGTLLLTGLSHPQVVRTAEVASIPAIVFVRGKIPSEETVSLARERGIPLLQTGMSLFEACGRLYGAGLKGCDVSQAVDGSTYQRGISAPAAGAVGASVNEGKEHGG